MYKVQLTGLQAEHNEERDALKCALSERSQAAVAAIANSVAAMFAKSMRQRAALLTIHVFKNWHTVAQAMASKRTALVARAAGRDGQGLANLIMIVRGW